MKESKRIVLATSNASPPQQGQPINIKVALVDRIEFYTGCRPQTINHTPTGKLLRVCLKSRCEDFQSNDNSESGICGFFRLIDINDNPIFDGTVGTCGTDIVISTGVEIVSGGILTVNATEFLNKDI